MKNAFIFILFLTSAMNVVGQSLTYAYDNAGNRTARAFSMSPAPEQPNAPPPAITSLSDLIAGNAVLIYPNPTKGVFSVEIKDYTNKLQVEFRVSDMSGRTVINRRANSGYQTFDISRFAAGIYLLQIRINGESVVWRIIKE